MAQSQRKNLEALTQANQVAIEGTQALLRRDLDLARQTMAALASMMSDLTGATGSMEDRLARQAKYSQKAIETGLANFRDLADLVTKTNSDAFGVLTKRVAESLDEARDYAQTAT